MSEVTLTLSDIASYSTLKSAMESYRSQGITKVNFPALQGTGVKSYTIPSDGNFIQLPPQVDFKGWTIIAENHKYNGTAYVKCPLFSIEKWSNEQKTDFHLTKADVDRGNYRMCPELCSGRKLLVLTDQKEWTYRTDTNDTGPFLRHDIIALNDGVPENKPIAPWDTPSTALSYYYHDANDVPVVIENLNFKRYSNVSNDYDIAKLIRIDGKYDVTFRNITVEFVPNSGNINRTGDSCFEIYNSAHVKFKDITVNGTYSATNAYGYAFYLDNVYNLSFHNVTATGLWGVIGTKSLNRTYLKDCTMNRFDIHCYGRDVKCMYCTFENNLINVRRSCDYGSMYGTLHYEKCIFNQVVPVFLPNSYHTYTGFDFVMTDCIIVYPDNSSPTNPGLYDVIICAGIVGNPLQPQRPELQKTNWPNVHINNLKLHGFGSNSALTLFKLNDIPVNPSENTIGYISQATVRYGIWTKEDRLVFPDVTVDLPAVPPAFSVYFSDSTYINDLVFDNAIAFKTAHGDINFL